MINGYDIAWGALLGLSAPAWAMSPKARRKVRRALAERMGKGVRREGDGPAVLIHAVSLGEMDATRSLVRELAAARPDLRFVVSTTTDTGYDRGRQLYGADRNVMLIRYPLDFSRAVGRVLDGVRPDVVVLMELEVWPNFLLQCERRGIPVVLVNGRLTPSSYRNYRLGRPLVAKMFRRLRKVCAQEETYARNFIDLGAPPGRVSVTGTMKFDTAPASDVVAGANELAEAVGLRAGGERVWVCGSTGPGEEPVVLEVYQRLREHFPDLRLVLVPRKPERFDEVAAEVLRAGLPLVRRSQPGTVLAEEGIVSTRADSPVVLGDTTGELLKFYSLADVVFVGRTLADLGPRQRGSNMIEPAALARPFVVGPFTHNFTEPMRCFERADAVRVVRDGEELLATVRRLLQSPGEAAEMGKRAQAVVNRERGATARHAKIILEQFDAKGVA